MDMCGPEATQSECALRNAPSPQGRRDLGPADRSQAVQQAGCEQWLLADTPFTSFLPVNHIYNTIRPILLKQAAFWYLKCTRALPKAHEPNPGLDGVVCQMDDILVFGCNKVEHDARLLAVLEHIKAAGATLRAQKCEFGKTPITFLGHKIDHKGIQTDPGKTQAIRDMKAPSTVSELRRFLGMVSQLGKFTPHLAHLTPSGLLSKDTAWLWGPDQRDAFTRVKEELSKPMTLALYDSQAPTRLSADASSYGLGAVLLQQTDGKWKPVAYASRSMTDTEHRYAQIEKEAIAIT